MKKELLYPIVGAAVLTTSLFTGTSVFAAEASQASSNAIVQFTPGDSTTPPVDPDNPDNPSTPENPTDPSDPGNGGTGQEGPLTINYVSNIKFGSQKISGTDQTYQAQNDKPNVQVSDTRGTGAGWSLTAQATPFKGTDKEEAVLKGAELSFKSPTIKSTSSNPSGAPTASDVTFDNTDAKLFLNAEAGKGQGLWVARYAKENVTLKVPAGVAESGVEYTATINWTLSDTPSTSL